MLEHTYRLSSSWENFTEECTRLENVFSNLHYPKNHINRIVNRFVLEKRSPTQTTLNSTTVKIARIALPFKDQKAADTVRRQLNDLGSKINASFQPVFLSKKLEDELKMTEKKPSIVNQQRVVYQFKCSICDENYISFTMRHLHKRCEEHKFNLSSIKKHFTNEMLPWSIHWVACGTCYRKSEGTELCGIELQHSSLWRITNKREARNIGFWADMLIIFKFPHNFFSPQV